MTTILLNLFINYPMIILILLCIWILSINSLLIEHNINNYKKLVPMKSIIHAVIFDLDGTLLDTETISTKAIEMVLEKYNNNNIDSSQHNIIINNIIDWNLKKKILGLRGNDWSRIVIEEKQLTNKLLPNVLIKEWEENLNNLYPSVKKMNGVMELIIKLHSYGIKLAIATSSNYEAMIKKSSYHKDLFQYIDLIVCGDDNDLINGKPSPDIYLLTAKRLNINPCHCLVFEDALTGVKAGISANMEVIAIPDYQVFTDIDQTTLKEFQKYTHHITNQINNINLSNWDFLRL